VGTTLQSDVTIGIKKETTYKTPVTVAAHYELLSETLQHNQAFLQGVGLRAGKITSRLDRRVKGKVEAVGDTVFEALSIDSTALIEAWLGSMTTGGSAPYYHLGKPAVADNPPSYTVQVGLPLRDGGAEQPHTYAGMCVTSGELTVGQDAVLQLKLTWTGADMATATSYVTPAYTASQELFSFHQVTTMCIGGTVVQPTTTAAASGGTAVTNIRDFSLVWDNALDQNGWNAGGAGKRTRPPAYGLRKGSGQFTAEFDAVTLRDAYLAGTSLPLLLVVTTAGGSKLTISLPAIVLEPGSMPASNAGDVITATCAYTVEEDGTNPPVLIQVQNTNAT
jgi:hypothetical protein